MVMVEDKLVQFSKQLLGFCRKETSLEVALAAVVAAFITGYPHYGERVLQDYYTEEVAREVYELLWEVASLNPLE